MKCLKLFYPESCAMKKMSFHESQFCLCCIWLLLGYILLVIKMYTFILGSSVMTSFGFVYRNRIVIYLYYSSVFVSLVCLCNLLLAWQRPVYCRAVLVLQCKFLQLCEWYFFAFDFTHLLFTAVRIVFFGCVHYSKLFIPCSVVFLNLC